MSEMTLIPSVLREGIWQGVIEAEQAPKLRATHRGEAVMGVDVSAHPSDENVWVVKIPVPQEAIADGVHTILINEAETDELLGQFSLIAGEAVGDDIRVELELLRAELDLLKRAFRRHCAETSG